MRSSFFVLAVAGLFSLFLVQTGCTKFDTTKLGTDLIPVVDNINTFQTELDVNSTQGIFNDTLPVVREDYHALGHIDNDVLFGKTTANIFLQLKPTYYPYVLAPGDVLNGLDSVVLCLSYKGTWGDTLVPQHLEVRKVEDVRFSDSGSTARPLTYAPNFTTLLGSADISIPTLKISKAIGKGLVSDSNQIRIRITNQTYLEELFSADTNRLSTGIPAYLNDSLFRQYFNGLGVIASNSVGNGLMYISLTDPTTRLEIHYKKTNSAGIKDTVFNSLLLAPTSGALYPSSTANNIIRNRTGFPVVTPSTIYNYLQTTPGSFINVDVPGLSAFRDTDRIINRAYLQVEQVPDNLLQDSLFTPPFFVYADLRTSSLASLYKPVYFDLNPNASYDPDASSGYFPASIDQSYFGGNIKYVPNASGIGRHAIYQLNLTRYLQRMIIKRDENYQIRITAPYAISYPQKAESAQRIEFPNLVGFGRVRVGSGTHPTQRMKLVIIWTKPK